MAVGPAGPAGIGDLFGQAVDAVIRRPLPAVLPLLVDGGAFLLGLLALAFLGLPAVEGAAYGRADFGFGISTALPSLADTLDVASAARAGLPGAMMLVVAVVVLLLPVVAFVEAGFVAVIEASYVRKDDRPLVDVFLPAARARFLPILLYRAVLAAAFLAAFALASQGGSMFRNSAAGALALRFLLMFAPYAIVVDGAGFLEGVRRSVAAIGDHVATCLVVLLFLLLTSGGIAAVLSPFVQRFGALAVLGGIVVYAPVGTVLATFVLLVWHSFRPPEMLAEPMAAPAAAPADAA